MTDYLMDQASQMGFLADRVHIEDENLRATVAQGHDGGKEARRFFAAIEELLQFYCSPENWPQSDKSPLAPIPESIARLIATQFGYLAVGKIPRPIKSCAKRGRTPPGPVEREDMRIAVAYVTAAKSDEIPDNSPIKTVSKLFGVDPRTVQQWTKEYGPCSPGDLGLAHITIENLPELVRTAGDRYQRAGRSTSAITRRNMKARAKTKRDFSAR